MSDKARCTLKQLEKRFGKVEWSEHQRFVGGTVVFLGMDKELWRVVATAPEVVLERQP